MDILLLAALAFVGAALFSAKDRRRRIALLASHLGDYQIEKLMEQLTEGYLRCLGEDDPARRAQIWPLLDATERNLARQFARFAMAFGAVDEGLTQVGRLPLPFPFLGRLLPGGSFDLRRLLAVHAKGIVETAENAAGRSPRDKAYTMSAELLLMQHSCHWFCRSKTVASARMLTRHKTSHAQLLAGVSPSTRKAYLAIVEGPA
ncbi:conserved hypothetical protein [Burkholderiales bacterium 8X]|nr:conserved hypothetical protein [Burkholderiales bacterium 8X]